MTAITDAQANPARYGSACMTFGLQAIHVTGSFNESVTGAYGDDPFGG